MKLSASTLGCPDWTLDQILTRFKAYGYDGVELRGLGSDLDLTQAPAFATPAAVMLSRQAFAEAGLEICCVDASARFTDADATERAKHAAEAR
ncbi:MAG: sugar phosphate isomerase/epimerase, partial [Armatimonadota bacterium]|nr:sugar phosphate isomerase/epimerase [Armatimonadota bacterium]